MTAFGQAAGAVEQPVDKGLKHLTPAVSTVVMGAASIAFYLVMNHSSNGAGVIGDSVIAIGLYIACHFGLTGFARAWYYRRNLDPGT
jgi:hypothetical protein